MPSYIELVKQATLPAASDISKVIFGITDQGAISIQDQSGSAIGGGIVPTTPNAFFQMRDMGTLAPGTLYYLQGADDNHGLVNGGVDVIVQATSTGSYNPRGVGKFYNPKYDKSVLGNNIWSPYVRFYLTNLSGSFQGGEYVTNNNGNEGYPVHNNQFFYDGGWQYIVPNTYEQWSGSLSITGSYSGATAEILLDPDPLIEIPTFISGSSKVVWGGKMWINKTGNVGWSPYIYILNEDDWDEIPYNETDYNVVWDEIEYDVENDFITMRKDKAGNIVEQTFAQWNWMESRSIPLFPWGNEYEYNENLDDSTGFMGNTIKASTVEGFLNFRGLYCVNNTIENSYMAYDIRFEDYGYMEYNTIYDSGMYSCFFSGDGFGIENNILNDSGFGNMFGSDYGSIRHNVIEQNSDLSNNAIIRGDIQYNTISEDSYIGDNYLFDYSVIRYNKLQDATIGDDNNYLRNYSRIEDNTLDSYGWIGGNNLYSSTIENNSLTSEGYIGDYNNMLNSSIYQNNLSNYSGIYSNEMTGSNLYSNTLTGESFINNNTLISGGEIGKNTITNNSSINSNTLIENGCFIVENTVANDSTIESNNLYYNSYFRQNTVTDSSYINSNNLTTGSYIQANTIAGDSGLYSCTLDSNSAFYANSIEMDSSVYSIIMYSSSYAEANKLTANSSMYSMTLDPADSPGNGYLYSNTLSNQSNIYNNVIGYAAIVGNDLKNNSSINDTTMGGNSQIAYNSLGNQSSINNINGSAGLDYILYNSLSNQSTITNFTMNNDESNNSNALFNGATMTSTNQNNGFYANI